MKDAGAHKLIYKYDVPAPRYTSYPTVPYWSDSPTADEWIQSLSEGLSSSESSWSLYIHIPFCETLCTFCGCNTSITKDHKKEAPYVDVLLREFDIYLEKVPALRQRALRNIHLGGGTPTFLAAHELGRLVDGVLKKVTVDQDRFEGSIEVDPRRTKADQLKVLRDLGFNRVSLGVQDFNPETQRLVNRIQPFAMTKDITVASRAMGFESVNFDLIYGLPKQTLGSIELMVQSTLQLRPDRIALYSLAVVPWIKPAQRLFKDEDLPQGPEKRALYERARELLIEGGYVEIGMDHFALKSDGLAIAEREMKLHRNFMGYSDRRTDVLLGLGVSAISEAPSCFFQNQKDLNSYENAIGAGEIALLRGHKLTEIDRLRREQILKLMTRFEVTLESDEQRLDIQNYLDEMLKDGLVELDGQVLRLTQRGRPFLRNACMALDQRLREKSPDSRIFSMSV